MSTPAAPEYAPHQYQPPAPKKKFNWKLALAVFAAVLIGGVIGSVSKPTPPPVVHVQEKIVEKEVTPASCLAALDINEQAFSYLSESLGHVLDGDYIASGRSTDKVKALLSKVNTAKADCRSK